MSDTFNPYRNGDSPVFIHYRNTRARVSLELGQEWTIKPCEELVAALNELEIVTQAGLRF